MSYSDLIYMNINRKQYMFLINNLRKRDFTGIDQKAQFSLVPRTVSMDAALFPHPQFKIT